MLTVTDLFAGAGGSSTGAIAVPGVEVFIAANHWQKAVDVHNANHPDALHVCADLSQVNPRYFPRTDILWASPECTNHSLAKGVRDSRQPDLFGQVLPDEAAERSRATMWDVPRFTEAHRYQAVIVENVVEVRRWAPYQAWLQAMDSLGYEHHEVYLNSAHAQVHGLPAPQSRDRIYVVFWRHGNRRPDLEGVQRPHAVCSQCGPVKAQKVWKRPANRWGRYRAQYLYACPECRQVIEPAWLPAAAAIDWSIKGERIGDRTRPLAEKTRKRIAAGIARYWHPESVDLALRFYGTSPRGGSDWSLSTPVNEPLRTLTTAGSVALVSPAGGTCNTDARPASEALRTLHTRDAYALVTPYYGSAQTAKPTGDPFGALTTRDRYALVTRHYSGHDESKSTPIGEPLRTLTTSAQQSLVTPGDIEAAKAQVDDCLFRMLEPHEVARGMAFPSDYIWEGTRRERVKMAGNAVTPPAARDLIYAVVEAIRGEEVVA